MNYKLACEKCNLNLKDFKNKNQEYYYCNCPPKNSHIICSGIFIACIRPTYLRIDFCYTDKHIQFSYNILSIENIKSYNKFEISIDKTFNSDLEYINYYYTLAKKYEESLIFL